MADLSQLFLLSGDLRAAREFYETALGLEPRAVGDASVAYETGACELKIQADFDPETLEPFGLSPPSGRRGEGGIVVLGVDEPLDELHERMSTALEDEPGEPLIEPREVPWGGRMFLARDPDGYVLELRPADE
ncbi:VOC family protein [Halorubrum ruber]|uniref:VOC family protein n=1 Tax=Halorubrum ruber TaxID=2982524 RepID=A0A8T8LJV0_9EURY|nr:VOC family protein [Halorubrum ruber]QUO47158.1 VOC family protein [Halorubrum ruber]